MNAMGKSLAAFLFVAAFPAPAHAIPVFFSWGGEKVSKVTDFPDDPAFCTAQGEYVDAGCKYKQVTIFFLPVWNYDKQWCGYVGKNDQYVEASRTELAASAAAVNVKLPESPSVPLWDSLGGKLIFILIVAVIVMFKALGGEDE